MGYTDNDQALYNGYGGMDPKPSEENSSSDLMMWVKLFLHYWYLFLIAVVVAVGIAFVKNCSWMPQYNTEAQVIIEPGMSSSQFSFMQGFGGTVDYTHTNNQLLIIGSYDIINRAISKLNFGVDYYVTDNFKTYNLYGREPVRIVTKYVADEAYAYQFRFVPVDDVSFKIVLDDKYSRDAYPGFVINGKYGEPIESPLFFGTVEKLYLPANNKEFLFCFRSVLSLEEEFVKRLGLRYVGSTRDLSTVLSVSLVGNACARDRDFINALGDLLPLKAIQPIVDLSGIDPRRKVNTITREERRVLVDLLHDLTVTPIRPRPIAEAIITKGGISVKEVDPKTMASKRVEGLYFAGEILDVDAYTGGFNLQIAFSTARLAARSAVWA